MTDIRQTKEYAQYLQKEGWLVERKNGINYFIRQFPLIGSILKIQRPKEIRMKEIEKIETKFRVFQTIIEPNLTIRNSTVHNLLLAHGFKLGKSPYLPSKTLHINLTEPISKITANFKKDAKGAIKRGEGLLIKRYSSISDIKKFHEAWQKSVKLTRFVPRVKSLNNLVKSFATHHPIILASHNGIGTIIGGAIFTNSLHETAYYWQAFTNDEGRTSLAQYSLLFQGILWAKRIGCRVFDFEGIFDERFPSHSWLGFTHFKKAFGGKEILFPGCYARFRFPYQ